MLLNSFAEQIAQITAGVFIYPVALHSSPDMVIMGPPSVSDGAAMDVLIDIAASLAGGMWLNKMPLQAMKRH